MIWDKFPVMLTNRKIAKQCAWYESMVFKCGCIYLNIFVYRGTYKPIQKINSHYPREMAF